MDTNRQVMNTVGILNCSSDVYTLCQLQVLLNKCLLYVYFHLPHKIPHCCQTFF